MIQKPFIQASFKNFGKVEGTKKSMDIVATISNHKVSTVVDAFSDKAKNITIEDPVEELFATLSTCKAKVIQFTLNKSPLTNANKGKVGDSLEECKVITKGVFDYAHMYGKTQEQPKLSCQIDVTYKIKPEFKDLSSEIGVLIRKGADLCPVYNILKSSGNQMTVSYTEI